MKKFLTYLSVIIATVALGFTVFYLVRDDEILSISAQSMYVSIGDTFSIELNHENPKAYTEVEVISTDEMVVNYIEKEGEEYRFTAIGGGAAWVTFRTSNQKFRNLSAMIWVGNGSIDFPYYISSAEQLAMIGVAQPGEEEARFKLSDCYKLVNNLNLIDGSDGSGYWTPIGTGTTSGFTGVFNGDDKTITNIRLGTPEQRAAAGSEDVDIKHAGLFSFIGQEGRVEGVKISGFRAEGVYENAGVVAGVNHGGIIERIDIANSSLKVATTPYVGGVVGQNISVYVEEKIVEGNVEIPYERNIARIDRCSVDVVYGDPQESSYTGLDGIVGGITGYNGGGIIVFSVAKGTAYLQDDVRYGGLIGFNSEVDLKNSVLNPYSSDIVGGHMKNCYTIVNIYISKINAQAIIGGVIAINLTSERYIYVVDNVQYTPDVEAELPGGETLYIQTNKIQGNYFRIADDKNQAFIMDNNSYGTVYGISKQGTNLSSLSNITSIYSTDVNASLALIASGKTVAQLQEPDTYKSHKVMDEVVLWSTDYWKMNKGQYPEVVFNIISVIYGLEEAFDGAIDSPEDLAKVNQNLNKNYAIIADINLFGFVTSADATSKFISWTPLGPDEKNPYTGTLISTQKPDGTYYVIKNLSISTSEEKLELADFKYAGLFGVLGKTAQLRNIVLENSTIVHVNTNGEKSYTGGIAGLNKGGTIINPVVRGVTIQGPNYVGGIVGLNQDNGTIINPRVSNSGTTEADRVGTSIALATLAQEEAYIGGIAGKSNAGSTIAQSTIVGGVTISAAGDSASDSYLVYGGGVVGHNAGSITDTKAYIDSGSMSFNPNINAVAGGIAGYHSGSGVIDSAAVSIVISATQTPFYAKMEISYERAKHLAGGDADKIKAVEAAEKAGDKVYEQVLMNPDTYVGGIVGQLVGNATIKKAFIYGSANSGQLEGRVVGGIVASMAADTWLKVTNSNKSKWTGEREIVPDASSMSPHISETFVDRVSLTGYLVGGLVGILQSGFVQDCYIISGNGAGIFSTEEAGAKVAGIVGEILSSGIQNDHVSCGFMNRVYAVTKFTVQDNATAYAESSSTFRASNSKGEGYILNYIFDKDVADKEAKTQDNGWSFGEKIGNWVVGVVSGQEITPATSTANMKAGSSGEKISKCGFNSTTWTFLKDNYGQLNFVSSGTMKEILTEMKASHNKK